MYFLRHPGLCAINLHSSYLVSPVAHIFFFFFYCVGTQASSAAKILARWYYYVTTGFTGYYLDDFSCGENTIEKASKIETPSKIANKWSKIERLDIRKQWQWIEAFSKILGIIWNETNDTLVFDFQEICDFSKTLNTTKWNVLKVFSMFYDPIGLDFCNWWSLIWKG